MLDLELDLTTPAQPHDLSSAPSGAPNSPVTCAGAAQASLASSSRVLEFFGHSPAKQGLKWGEIVEQQHCPYTGQACYKTRKSAPEVAIGTCVVQYGPSRAPLVICPAKLLERRQVFTDCLHLLALHEPGNELHLIPEVPVPGGRVDFMLASVRRGEVVDFVGVETQALDTTGTVWPERQQLLKGLGLLEANDTPEDASFAMNWKMSAKTCLVQVHHKIRAFENLGKKLVLVMQDRLHDYICGEFQFDHLQTPARAQDALQLHLYQASTSADQPPRIDLARRLSTDAAGVARGLGLQNGTSTSLEGLLRELGTRISTKTAFAPVQLVPAPGA
jgi:hypothetical protein